MFTDKKRSEVNGTIVLAINVTFRRDGKICTYNPVYEWQDDSQGPFQGFFEDGVNRAVSVIAINHGHDSIVSVSHSLLAPPS